MTLIPKPIRIEPAFDNREQIRAMFERHAPYPALAIYLPEDSWFPSTASSVAKPSIIPMFRGNWAVAGKPLVDGAEVILHNQKFLEAAKALFGTSLVHPSLVVVNVNAPMPASPRHVDIPCFHGATREQYPLPILRLMGSSGLFETWRVIQAGAVAWFYEGTGGNFDYWPEGPDGPMLSEQAPFGKFALMADNDRMYHSIGLIGDGNAQVPQISASTHPARWQRQLGHSRAWRGPRHLPNSCDSPVCRLEGGSSGPRIERRRSDPRSHYGDSQGRSPPSKRGIPGAV